MDDKTAIKLLENSANQIDSLKNSYRFSREHTKWLTDTIYLLEEIFGRSSKIYLNFRYLDWQFRGTAIFRYEDPQEFIEQKHNEAYLQDLETARGLIESGIDLIKRRGLEAVYEDKNTPREASEIIKIVSLVENNFRKVIRNKPSNEREINDALETLFIGAGLDKDFTREKEHILYSSKTYIPDFVFKRIGTIVETKFCDKSEREKVIIGEINDDIVAYKTVYPNLIFVVYDLGIIRNMDEFKDSIEKQVSVIVKVIKH